MQVVVAVRWAALPELAGRAAVEQAPVRAWVPLARPIWVVVVVEAKLQGQAQAAQAALGSSFCRTLLF
jgi:hypothetical protein